ncbi:hypothetical protein [Paracoccus shanxieyensis]|uniref:Uncharacterized protein n=1 Tax=Paracoccus shanxieyensis TaxID=2675752 RepID=A0A6L6IWW0_9RHOB|nr:hypothetical protein [Paracoccus shanxieyensis]MTH64693.1 hypothetical protein [Paracoccus shanxieyensis]MTH87837.1 hypothetical protein [Paracoccus shanxieyensis]
MIRFALNAFPQLAPVNHGYATIALSGHQSAQGPVVRKFRDGRVVIDTGRGRLTGRPLAGGQEPIPVWAPIFVGM